eukprot:GHVP01053572.1.p1 GENE.GHVP01053572.1~~GHVP01053572.1.p1  ORF type:complete len:335 (-),score=41.49 GHVP01053572.1:657-1661(-)
MATETPHPLNPFYASSMSSQSHDLSPSVAFATFRDNPNEANYLYIQNDDISFRRSIQSIKVPRVISHINWAPPSLSNDILAFTAKDLFIVNRNDSGEYYISSTLKPRNEDGRLRKTILTSFDWSISSPNRIISSSFDCACTLWDLKKEVDLISSELHKAPIYDLSICQGSDFFASCSADTTVIVSDIRSPSKNNIIYEDPKGRGVLRIEWSSTNTNKMAFFCENSTSVYISDVRMPLTLFNTINVPGNVTSIKWAPHKKDLIGTSTKTGFYLANVNDNLVEDCDGNGLIKFDWSPVSKTECIQNIDWNHSNSNKVLIGTSENINMINLKEKLLN